ncbi:hypothetical protein Egran_01076 [Elaphomyces granulatus]|uniref:Ubiquitin-like domain-containing protein n=1 Tax=Elaphomyces granulatus TaxID=519963 RepID=A0A232M426_9EURO|nr:hypothetical protein Egran_01076 [Elaphomyces granulatus]
MAEIAFTKSFLSALDSRPIKLQNDYIADPQTLGLRGPYTLPRMPSPHPSMPKKIKTPMVPGSSKSVTIHLKSPRNPILEFSIDNVPLSTTTIQDLKDAVRERILDNSGNVVALDKIKILYKKKPVAGKTVADVLADEPEALNGGKEIEFGVMIIGGANVVEPNVSGITAIAGTLASASNSVPEPGVLQTDAFWKDLETFLEQRINDRLEAVRLASLFKTTWHAQQ